MNILFDIIKVASVLLEILIALNLFKMISNKKQIPIYIEIIINIVCITVQSVVIIFISKQTVVSITLFLLIVVLSFVYNLTWQKRFFFSILLMILYTLSEIVIGLILAMISEVSVEQLSGNILYYIQGVLVSKLIMFFIIKIIGYFSVKSEAKVSRYVFIPFMALPLATFSVVYVMSEFMFQSQPGSSLVISTIAIIFLIISNVLVFYMFEYQLKITEDKKQEQMIKQQLEYKAEYYKELSRRQHITNKTMHDLKNQLFALREIFKSNTKEGIDKINIICEDILSVFTLKFTGIEAVDALITAKLQIMREKKIGFSNSIYIPENNYLDILDFCVLLGNLLDNAIEANAKVPIQNRYVNLSIIQQLDYISINVSNTVSENVKIEENRIITTKNHKELHGFGLKSVKEIVKKYKGNCTFQQIENKFEVIIILKNK